MDSFSKEELQSLLTPCAGPCISLYQPTTRTPVEGRQDLIRFKNLVREAKKKLAAWGLRPPEAAEGVAPLQRLLDDEAFWQYRGDGLAVFVSQEKLRAYRLPAHFDEMVVVCNHFHLKPLVPILTEDTGFMVLALSQKEVRLLEGNRYGAWEVELDHIPQGLAEALRYDQPERQFQFRTQPPPSGRGGVKQGLFFAHGVGIDDTKEEICRYFQIIDKGLQEVLRPDHTPLILAGVEYLLPLYREVNSYPHLLSEAITGNPELLGPKEIHERAWKILQPRFLQERQEALSQYKKLAGTGRASGELAVIVPAAVQGRIDKLVVATGAEAWGSYLPEKGAIELHDAPATNSKNGSEDLLDLSSIQAVINGGKVYAAPPEALPEHVPAVAIFRY